MIENLLTESTIRLKVVAANWEDAGKKAGELLLENHSIQEDYIHRMIEAVQEYGPYIVIAPGIALFHARPESSVKDICLSMITLESPVVFGAGENDPVDLVFALGAIDHESHLQAMAELMVILQDNHLVNLIKSEDNTTLVLNQIHQKILGG